MLNFSNYLRFLLLKIKDPAPIAPSELYRRCSNKSCPFLNGPQAVSGTYNCIYVFNNTEKCTGTYKVTAKMASAAVKYIKERREQETLEKMAKDRERRRTLPSLYCNSDIARNASMSAFIDRESQMTGKFFSDYLQTKPLPQIPSLQSQPLDSMTSVLTPTEPSHAVNPFLQVQMRCFFPQDDFSHCQQFSSQRGLMLPSTQLHNLPPMKIINQPITASHIRREIPQVYARPTWSYF